ncbi:MAG: hypothetical protein NXI31_24815 [bacterium]|nr:hypothetical protein [bacterium]
MRHLVSALAAGALTVLALPAQGDLLYTINNSDGEIRAFDLESEQTISSVTITSSGRQAVQCNGMARNPVTGVTYVLAVFPGSNARRLCSVDLGTGAATVIGTMSDNFSSLACRVDGTLYGVTGDGANTPETLYTIDQSTAVATLVRPLGNGDFGEAIGFGDDLFLYHASGWDIPNVEQIFERIDTFSGNTLTNIPLSGFDPEEFSAITSFAGGQLLAADLGDNIIAITTTGHVEAIGVFDHGTVRGLVYEPSPQSQGYFRQYGTGCAQAGGQISMLFGSGTPVAGQSIGIHLRLAPVSSFGLLAFGFGSGTLPVPSPTCQVQINPVISSTGFFASAAGEANWTIPLPSPFAPLDLYIQTGSLDGGNFVVSNPLLMHTQ